MGRVTGEVNHLNFARNFAYDAAGRVTEKSDRNDRITRYEYNGFDQTTAEKWYESNGTTLVRTLSFSYDDAGQLTDASDPSATYEYTYDNLGRTLTVSNNGTSGVPTVVLAFAYNANGNRTTLAAEIDNADDFLNTYAYDNLSRLTRIEQIGQSGGNAVAKKAVNFAYDAASRWTTITRQAKPSSTWDEVATSIFTYDALGRLTALDHAHSTTTIAAYDWTYDAASRITQFSSPDGTSDYDYDNTSQLTGADHTYQTDESYSYDENGNRTMSGYDTGDNNQLLSDGGSDYEYDNEGNRILRTNATTGAVTEYTWDWRNRLVKVVERGSSTGPITKQTDFVYDVLDRRLEKFHDADGADSGSAAITRYVYDGIVAILQFDGADNLTHRYLGGPTIEPILADEAVTSLASAGTVLWPLTDHLGTVRDLVNDSGTVQNHIKYDSFGNVTSESNSAIDFLFGFAAGIRDEETGLQYHRARYYDPATGRWISEDPIGFGAGDTNLDRYAGNKSVLVVDPSGKSWRDVENYFHYLTNPWDMDQDLEYAFYGSLAIAGTAALGAGGAAALGGSGSASIIYNTSMYGSSHFVLEVGAVQMHAVGVTGRMAVTRLVGAEMVTAGWWYTFTVGVRDPNAIIQYADSGTRHYSCVTFVVNALLKGL